MTINTSHTDHLWFKTALLIAAAIPLTLLALAIEERTFNGINLWIKPLKFQTSAAVHLLTLYFAAKLMAEAARHKRPLKILVWLAAIATVLEIFFITLRAGQASASHYNYNTPTDAILYGLMGVGAVTMLAPAIYLGVRFLGNKDGFIGQTGLHFGISSGFIVGSILTLIFASYMSRNGSHWTSGQTSDAGGLPLFGWSQTGGDLRPAHFFALHMMQALPFAGWLGDKFYKDDSKAAKRPVWIGLIVMAGLSIFTFIQALNGNSFIRL